MRTLFFLCGVFIISFTTNVNSQTTLEEKKELTYQDSLRTVILNSLPHEGLKYSILKELYIRDIVNPMDDKIEFHLPFNLHGLDCYAPDCYSTDISFNIPASNPIVFPDKFFFTLVEHGCVEKEISIIGSFELMEKTTEYVNYYSKKLKSNLIMKQGGELYYYAHQKPLSVTVEKIDEMFENYDFEKENVIVPYRSNVMMTTEYQYFIKK